MLGPPAVTIALVLGGAGHYLPWLLVGTLGLSTHVAMLAGMIVWMLYRGAEIEQLGGHNPQRRSHRPAHQTA